MAQAYRDGGYPHAAGTLEAGVIDSVDACALSAIEQALTQQRGSASYNAGIAMHWIELYAAGIDEECQLDRIAEAFTTPHPSADAVREYVTELRAQADQKMGVAGACAHDGDRARYKSAAQLLRRVADELEPLLSGGSHA